MEIALRILAGILVGFAMGFSVVWWRARLVRRARQARLFQAQWDAQMDWERTMRLPPSKRR